MATPELSFELAANLTKFENQLKAGVGIAEAQSKNIVAAFGKVSGIVGTLVGGAFVAGIQSMVKANVEALDSFNDLHDATGASIENISALDRIARETGGSFETVFTSLVKFNSVLTKTDEEGKTASRVFQALGLDAEALKTIDPAEALLKTAIAFQNFADDGNKARAAQILFGKSIQEVAPFLKDLAEKGKLVAIVTAEQAQEAENYVKAIAEMKANHEDFTRQIVSSLLPALNSLLRNYKDLKEQGNLGLIVKDAAKDILGFGKLTGDAAADINKFIVERDRLKKDKTFADSKGLATRDIDNQIGELNEYIKIAQTKQRNAILGGLNDSDSGDALNRRLNGSRQSLNVPAKPPTVSSKVDHSAEQEAKAQLALDIDEIKKRSEAIAAQFTNSENVMQALRSAGLLDDKDYYTSKLGFLNLTRDVQAKALQDEIARLQQEKLTGKAAIDNEKQILDAKAKLAALNAKTVTDTVILSIQEKAANDARTASYLSARQAAQDYFDTVAKGYARELAGIGQGTRNRERNAGLAQIDDTFTNRRRDLENNRSQAEAQGTFGAEAQKKYDFDLALLREFHAKELAAYIDQFDALTKARENWLNGASEALQNYFDESRDVAKGIGDLFGNTFKGLEDQVTNLFTGKTVDIKGLFNSIDADLVRQLVKTNITGPLADALNGQLKSGDGIGGAIGGFLTSLFGGGTGAGKGAADPAALASAASAASLTALGVSTGATTVVMTSLAAAATAAAAALATMAASGGGSAVSGLFGGGGFGTGSGFGNLDFGGFFAEGGKLNAGQFGIAGEKGAELVFGPATIVPQSKMRSAAGGGSGGGHTYITNVSIEAAPNMSRSTAMQQGAAYGRGIQQSMRRNG